VNNHLGTAASTTLKPSSSCYVEVAVPLHVSKTFIYRFSSEEAKPQIGVRILVPLGRKLVTGYVVAFYEALPPHFASSESELKDAGNVIDSVPVCTSQILDLTRWVSDYYASPWGEVIKGALPPGISPAIHEFVSLTEEGRTQEHTDEVSLTAKILNHLSTTSQPTRRDSLSHFASMTQVSRTLHEMENEGLIERTQTQSNSFVKTKQMRFVRLLPESLTRDNKLTSAQERVIASLKRQVQKVPLQVITS
jgi:primosomal protein N' (replication factor Y)